LDDASARAINAQAWEPPPGMVKRQCPQCRYWFRATIITIFALRCPMLVQSGQHSSLLRGEAANQYRHCGHCRLTMPGGGSHACALMARADASSGGSSTSGASYWWL